MTNKIKNSIHKYGVIICLDEWDNINNCPLLNIILVYPNRNFFLKTINTIEDWKDAQYICNALVEYIQNMAMDKFVQIYTDNASNMWNTSNILRVHYPIIYFHTLFSPPFEQLGEGTMGEMSYEPCKNNCFIHLDTSHASCHLLSVWTNL